VTNDGTINLYLLTRFWNDFASDLHESEAEIFAEIAVNDDYVERTISAIVKGAKTGELGDGKIFVYNLEECVRIRTEERGHVAIG
jgi:nitrogen regulatory protein PII